MTQQFDCPNCGTQGTVVVDEVAFHVCESCGVPLKTYFTDSDVRGVAVGRYLTVEIEGRDVAPPRNPYSACFGYCCGAENMMDGPQFDPWAEGVKLTPLVEREEK